MTAGSPSRRATPAGAPTVWRSAATTARRCASPSRSTAAREIAPRRPLPRVWPKNLTRHCSTPATPNIKAPKPITPGRRGAESLTIVAVVTSAVLLATPSVAQGPPGVPISDHPTISSELARGWRAGQTNDRQNGAETRTSLASNPSKAFGLGAMLSTWQSDGGFIQTYSRLSKDDKTGPVKAIFTPACNVEARDFADLESRRSSLHLTREQVVRAVGGVAENALPAWNARAASLPEACRP